MAVVLAVVDEFFTAVPVPEPWILFGGALRLVVAILVPVEHRPQRRMSASDGPLLIGHVIFDDAAGTIVSEARNGNSRMQLAVQIDALFVSPLSRPVQRHRRFGTFQQSWDLFMTSIHTARRFN